MLKIAFYVNAALEILAGAIFFFTPEMFPNASGAEIETLMIRMYGAAALAIGVCSFLAAQRLDNRVLVRVLLTTFVIFHVGVALVNWMGAPDMGAAILHTVMAVLFLYLYFTEK